MSRRLTIIVFVCMSLLSACKKSVIDPVDDASPVGTVWKLNKNVEGLKKLAMSCMKADSVAFLSIHHNGDGSVLYGLSMKYGSEIELLSEIVSEEIRVPELSMDKVDGIFYWMINGSFLTDSDGNRVSVTDLTMPVSFLCKDETICCQVKNSIVGSYPFTKAIDFAKDVSIEYAVDRRGFDLHLSSGFSETLPTVAHYELLNAPVFYLTYYKDIFLDAGIGLDSMKSLPAAKLLNLTLEGIAFPYSNYSANDKSLQEEIISGNSKDSNGRLLYPDGQPRYKLLYVIGGNSRIHSGALGEVGLKNLRTFVDKGGCYVGSCAGAFLASNGYDGHKDFAGYLSIWPGMMRHTGLRDTYTGMFIEKEGPLSRYYDFGGDHYVDSVRHNYGGYAEECPVGTEVLARYDTPSRKSVRNTPSIWAYKASQQSGRIVLTGSHPEIVSVGERRDLTAAMLIYAMEGRGTTSLKGYLKNGEERKMDKTTEDQNSAFTRIGDYQTHHFATYIPAGAKNIKVMINGSSSCDFALRMDQDVYALANNAKYQSSASGSRQQLSFPSIQEGYWFISAQCLSSVTVNAADYGQEYRGNLAVLNGIPYTVSVSWE